MITVGQAFEKELERLGIAAGNPELSCDELMQGTPFYEIRTKMNRTALFCPSWWWCKLIFRIAGHMAHKALQEVERDEHT